jgi:PKD repeat protein
MTYDVPSGTWSFSRAYGATGVHTYVVTARDTAGNVGTASGAFSVQDTTPPALFAAAATPDPVELDGAVTISVSATDVGGVASVAVAIQLPSSGTMGPFLMANVAGDRYEYVFTTTEVGDHSSAFTGTDVAGNVATFSGVFTVDDATPPSVGTATAVPDPVELGTSTLLSGTASDLGGVASVIVEVRDPSGVSRGTFPMTLAAGRYERGFTADALGTHTFTITATDASGNTGTAAGTFSVRDTTVPIADAGPDGMFPAGTTVTLDGTASSDNDGIASYTWTFVVSGAPVTLSGANPTHRFDTSGSYPVTLTVEDPSGNAASDSVTITVTALLGSVRGLVTDSSALGIGGALVRLMNGTTVVASTSTGPDGTYEIASVPPGAYTVRVEASGFSPYAATVLVAGGSVTVHDVRLSRSAPAEGSPLPAILALAIIIVAAAIVVTYIFLRRRGRRPPADSGDGEDGEGDEPEKETS